MSILISKHSGWTYEGRRTPYFGGGGGGSPAPSISTAYQTNVPEYAKPYVTNMLEATQRQLFNMDESGITGFKPYRPYSTNVNDYFAGFSPLQQQAQQAAYGLQTPQQFGAATGLAGAAGAGGLSAAQQAGALGQQALGYGATGAEYGGLGAQQALAAAQQTARQAGIYGGMGAGYGARGVQAAEQGFGAGEAFARQATDPYATAAYMSPYMQNVVDYQKSQALRDYGIGQGLRRAQAVGAGAFGGSRQAIAEAEAERALGSQLQGIAAQGSQKAFEDAQRQQQFGAQLGLQGLQAGYGGLGMGMQGAGLGLQGVGAQQAAGQLGLAGTAQGMQGAQAGLQGVGQAVGAGQLGLGGLGAATQAAGALGQLGGAQLGAQRDIIGLQSQMGAQQQAFEQQKINQAIQDYATMQQYPLMQLGFMSNMLRGLPMQATTTQTYQATPSALTQGLGVLAGAAGAKQAGLFAEGGTIKGLASGGVAGYANRGMVQANPTSGVVRGIRQKLEMMTADQLQQVAQTSPSEEIRAMAIQILQEQKIREQAEEQAKQSIAQDQQRGLPTPVSERAGLPAAPAGAMDMLNAASGGIVAFAGEDESLVEGSPNMFSLDPEKEMEMRQKYIDMFKRQREAAGIGAPKAGLADVLTKEKADLAEDRKQARGYELMRFGTRLATQTGPLLYAGSKAAETTLPGMIESERSIKTREREINRGLADIAEGERLIKIGDIEGGNKLFNQAADRLSKEKIAGTRAAIADKAENHARAYLANARANNDNRPEEVILLEGRNDYLTKVQQAQMARAGVAQQQVAITGANLTRDDANKEIATVGTPGNETYKARVKAREAQPDYKNLSPAEKKAEKARIRTEVRDEIMAKNQSGVGRPSAPSGGGSKKPEVIKLD